MSHCEKLLDISESSTGSKSRKQEIKTTRGKFYNLVQEMIALLPDLDKQDELYLAYVTLGGNEKTRSSSPISLNAWGSASGSSTGPALVRCEFCTQYLTSNEINFHQMSYHGKQVNTPVKSDKKASQKQQVEEFPSLMPATTPSVPLNWASKKESPVDKPVEKQPAKKKTQSSLVEEFPPLSTQTAPSLENRFSAMPSASIFSNPSSHLSLVNKKKHRLQK